ncbi:MAG: hypothetical protein JXA91_05890 [Candidatus Thermoplasmatota archaeon]|nr:hypothetical protein [Candidatus Thermoplasmatota archaeon]
MKFLNLKKPRLFCLFSAVIVILSTTLVTISYANPIMNVIEEKEDFENLKNNYFLNGNFCKSSLIKSTDFWEILKNILIKIVNMADFLYNVVEPFIIILFTVIFTFNPNLALAFITFVLILRFLSMIEIDTETFLSLANRKKIQNTLN